MLVRLFVLLGLSSLLIGLPIAAKAAERVYDESVLSERQGRLHPPTSQITNLDFWNDDSENSWYIAINYLSCFQENKDTLKSSKDKAFFVCVGAAYLRINYRLQDSEDPNMQASMIREFEPSVADFVNEGRIPLTSLWLKDLPEVKPQIVKEGVMQILHTTEVPPKFLTRLPSSYQGTNLWVGGERNVAQPSADQYILNVDKAANPDMLADGSNAYHLMMLPDDKFKSILFDHIGHTVLTQITLGDVLGECSRISMPGGVLTFRTEHASEDYYQDLIQKKLIEKIRKNLTKSGFLIEECKLTQDMNEEWKSNPFYITVTARKK